MVDHTRHFFGALKTKDFKFLVSRCDRMNCSFLMKLFTTLDSPPKKKVLVLISP